MRAFVLLAFTASAFAQQSNTVDVAQMLANQMAPPADANRVVAVVDGTKVTAAELFRYYKSQSSNMQFYLAQNRRELVERYATSRNILKEAEKNKLDQKEPYKTKLLESREQILTLARNDELSNSRPFTDQEMQEFYNAHPDPYTSAIARVIMVPAGGDPKQKAAEILKRIRGGEPFDAVAKEVSADSQTGEKGGLIGSIAKDGSLAEEFRNAIFSLKPGQTSEPVELRGSLWIFSVDSIQVKSYEQVKGDVLKRMKDSLVEEHMQAIRSRLSVKIEDEEYFKRPEVPQSLGPQDADSAPAKK
jgi:parvulin-like peptidyl-prolyl isomerase